MKQLAIVIFFFLPLIGGCKAFHTATRSELRLRQQQQQHKTIFDSSITNTVMVVSNNNPRRGCHRQGFSFLNAVNNDNKKPSSYDERNIIISDHLEFLNSSFKKVTGQTLVQYINENNGSSNKENDEDSNNNDWYDTMHMSMRWAVYSHGSINGFDGPTNNYGNFATITSYSYPRTQFCNMPACRMALPGLDQEQLTNVFLHVKEHGSLLHHNGFRCTSDQRKFYIRNAIN